MRITGDTHIGLVRNSNQDALRFGPLGDGGIYFAVVCDGMGGANGGNIASHIALDMITQRLQEAYADGRSPRTPAHLLESAMAAANIEIFERSNNDPTLEGMGTTVVVAIVDGRNAYISHVGDSRLYLYRDRTLQQITRDHSVVQDMIESGQLTEEQARSHPRKHFITRALGVSEVENGEYDEFELHSGDMLLLCTDGLTNMVENKVLSDILASGDESIINALIEAALDKGGSDNITAVLFEHK